jgi:hypothetical protein
MGKLLVALLSTLLSAHSLAQTTRGHAFVNNATAGADGRNRLLINHIAKCAARLSLPCITPVTAI